MPKKNVVYEVFQFRQAVQMPGETVEQFATRLRKIAVNCEFTDVKREIKTAIIQHCLSKRLRRFALREADLTLDGLLAKARSQEASEVQASGMEEILPGLSMWEARIRSLSTIRTLPAHSPSQPHTWGQVEQAISG